MKTFFASLVGFILGVVFSALSVVGLMGATAFYLAMKDKEEEKTNEKYTMRSYFGKRPAYTMQKRAEETS